LSEAAPLLRAAGIPLHTDATQAWGRVPVRADTLGAGLLSLSAHKFGGPAGIGALLVMAEPKGAGEPPRWTPPQGTGSQELGRRPGTEAVLLAAGLAAAARAAAADLTARDVRHRALAADLRDVLLARGGELLSPPDGLPGTLLVAFPGVPGDTLLAALDGIGIQVSAGTACTSLARTPPEVLLAAGHPRERAARAVRFSLPWNAREDDASRLAAALDVVLPRVRNAPDRAGGSGAG
jgi:cysteine desulfurase